MSVFSLSFLFSILFTSFPLTFFANGLTKGFNIAGYIITIITLVILVYMDWGRDKIWGWKFWVSLILVGEIFLGVEVSWPTRKEAEAEAEADAEA
jgi:hypothetical protein